MTAPTQRQTVVSKARTLVEALPYIKRYSGKTVVVKYGGNAMRSSAGGASVAGAPGAGAGGGVEPNASAPDPIRSLARDLVLMHYVGMRPVVVHGAGPQISELMRRLQQEPRFVDGYRVTGAAELDVVRMVLQKTNKELVALVNAHGDLAVGISGEDANLIRARKMSTPSGSDLGYVGEVAAVDPRVVTGLLESGFMPVIAPIGVDDSGQGYNINADVAAGAIAAALGASKLVYLTDVEGLYRDFGDSGSLLSRVTTKELRELLGSGRLSEGMIPKVTSCIEALEGGVERAHILDGRVEHALLLEIFTDEGIGTMVTKGADA